MKKKIVAGTFLLALFVAGFFAWKVFGPAVSNKEAKYFYIKTGETMEMVKENLVQKKIISNTGWFDQVASWLKYKSVKPGRYEIKDGTSLVKLVKMLRGGFQSPVKMVIIKERTKELFAGKMGKKFDVECDSLQMIQFLNNNNALKKYEIDTNTVMAIVMPYTYSLNWNSTPEKIFEQFYTAYKKFWTDERKAKADSLHLSLLQISSLAAIVDEETNKKEDKLNVASTYLNRVRTGMKLQADPTVKFAMKNFGLKRVLSVHLKTDSPYNTYMYAGIPPGPICTPTPETIDAVLNAPKTDYLFFVASHKFDGSSVFTTNLADHSKYARLYQQELTRRMDSAKKANQNLIK
jgi:UPF0755 protein